ncbi:MAG: tripartite tricarboxylate transporter TctB family protein [Mailhella sp.]|nr:tripartite tricarboxylate transporter TctB family protein [Mailhella sp.]
MRKQEIIINFFLLAFALGMIFWIIPAWTAEPTEYGLAGGTLPSLCCWSIATLATFQIISGVLKGIRENDGKGITWPVMLHMVKWFAPMFCIVPLWYYFGFLTGSIPVLFVLLLLGGRRDWKIIVPVAVGIPVLIMLALLYGLQVPTP